MTKIVQESFGEKIIETITEFAKNDLKSVVELKGDEFSHVDDDSLRDALAITFYGARWLYKLGLSLLVRDEEQLAHVRAQVIDYGAVCEGLLSDAIHHALIKNIMHGQKYKYSDAKNLRNKIDWRIQRKLDKLRKLSFYWHIEVAFDEGMIDINLKDKLHKMRTERNTVHVRRRTYKAYISTSKLMFDTVIETIRQIKVWRAANP